MVLAFAVAVLIPLTLGIWLLNLALYMFYNGSDVWEPLSPLRLVLAVVVPYAMAQWGLRRHSLNNSGARAGFIIGFIMTLSNYGFMAALLAFFVAGSKVTKWRSSYKRKVEADFKEGGQRDWMQVVCNGGVAAELAVIHMINAGCGEYAVDFRHNPASSWLVAAVLGALACCCGDTFASEIGSAVGTNGGMSIAGTLSSALGGSVIGLAYFVVILVCGRESAVGVDTPPQWPLLIVTTLAGFLGSLIDSLLGATLQYSGFDRERNCVVEKPGSNVEHISGSAVLDNHGVNLVSSALTAIISPSLALAVWRRFL